MKSNEFFKYAIVAASMHRAFFDQVNTDTSLGMPNTSSISRIAFAYPLRFSNGMALLSSNLVTALHRRGFLTKIQKLV